MAETVDVAAANMVELAENPYPGRGIVLGLSQDGETALQAYWVMGRSENSRNRLLVEEDDVVRTAAYDESKVTDPSLIIYNAMRIFQAPESLAAHVVSNGDQTDTIVEGFEGGQAFATSLKTREYEPDEPNYTPRISGLVVPYRRPGPDGLAEYGLSVISKASADSDAPVHDYFRGALSDEDKGAGHCVHTYLGDGSPLPSFQGEPFAVPVGEGINDTAEMFWEALNADNRVAIAVKGIRLATGDTSYRIINAHEE
jgi:hypothetical protein